MTAPDSSRFEELMDQGRVQFQLKQYEDALQTYSQALLVAPKPKLHLVHSNRAGCLLQIPNRAEEALKAAILCYQENPEFLKGYHRMTQACMRLNQFERAKDIMEELFFTSKTIPGLSEADARAELDLYAEAVIKSANLESKMEEEIMLAAMKAYAQNCSIKSDNLPVLAHTLRQAPRFAATMRNNDWFSRPLGEFALNLGKLLNEVTADAEQSIGQIKDREDYMNSKWSILWADTPPTRATLERRTGLKWPPIEDYHCMRPHAAVNSRVTVADVQRWYGDMMKGMTQETIEMLTRGEVLPETSGVLQKVRLNPGKTVEWWQWYAEHQQRYRQGFQEFQQVCEDCTVYDVYTKEFIGAFVSYLVQRMREILSKQDSIVIGEVGAGDGRLLRYVTDAFPRVFDAAGPPIPGKKIVFAACDTRQSSDRMAKQQILNIDHKNFLNNMMPHIVFCSWMPQGTDWTIDFRKSPVMEEYLLLGPCDTGLTGDTWRTWGVKRPLRAADDSEPPFVRDGWFRTDLHDVSRHLISKDDASNEYFNSSVVSFRRGDKPM